MSADNGQVPFIAILPFILCLLAIALLPLAASQWWKRYSVHLACVFVLVGVCASYFGGGRVEEILHSAHEYASFIILLGALYVVSGGIYLGIRGRATPSANLLLLAAGALLANLLGTMGASVMLIRPYMRSNAGRLKPFHVVFFIFIVGNIGGSLTPVGDPPLFLGYLKGIPFFWFAENIWTIWLLGIGVLLAVFWLIDSAEFRKHVPQAGEKGEEFHERATVKGGWNLIFLGVIVGACLLPGIPFLREVVMITAALCSWRLTSKAIHGENRFAMAPMIEVGVIFAAIFMTMGPAMRWLGENSAAMGVDSNTHLFWGTGALSSVLDNAPTFLSVLSSLAGRFVEPSGVEWIRTHWATTGGASAGADSAQGALAATMTFLHAHAPAAAVGGGISRESIVSAWLLANVPRAVLAASVGAVFFGAMTYIGNGPNFMVKAIADHQGVRMPGFFGYIFRYAGPILLPLFGLIWWCYFRT